MRSNKRSQDRFPGMTSVNSYASVYFDAWQNYFDTLNEVWGDVTAPDAQFGAWTSGFSKLLQAWTDGAADVCGAYTSAHRDNDEHVVAFVVDRDAECTDPKTVSLPPGTQCPHVEWTDLRGTGGSGGPQIRQGIPARHGAIGWPTHQRGPREPGIARRRAPSGDVPRRHLRGQRPERGHPSAAPSAGDCRRDVRLDSYLSLQNLTRRTRPRTGREAIGRS